MDVKLHMRRAGKAIFIDLDGTMLNGDGELTPRTVAAIKRVKAKGYEVVICTGKSYNRTQKYFDVLGSRYAICSNGAAIYDCANKKIVYQNVMSAEDVLKVCEVVEKFDAKMLFLSGETRYFSSDFSNEFTPHESDTRIDEPMHEFLSKNGVVQVVCISRDLDEMKKVKRVLESTLLTPGANIKMINHSKVLSNPDSERDNVLYYDIVDAETSKGNGIAKFCEMFGTAKKSRIAIGDSMNDISMFGVCGLAAAMENGLPELKKKANVVIGSCHREGVAEFLESLS